MNPQQRTRTFACPACGERDILGAHIHDVSPCPDCEEEECVCMTPDDIAYERAQAIWNDLGLGGL